MIEDEAREKEQMIFEDFFLNRRERANFLSFLMLFIIIARSLDRIDRLHSKHID